MGKEKRTIDMASEMFNDIPRIKDLPRINIKDIRIPLWLENLQFKQIMLVWVLTVIFFGMVYYYLPTDNSYLFYTIKDAKVDIFDAVYFSFITATTTGYGDIIPMGIFKVISIMEVVFGFGLLSLIISKLISIKQNVILTEIYEISFHERINEIRSSLLLFRQNMTRLIYRIEEKKIKKKELKEISSYIIPLEISINEISLIIGRKEKSEYTKNVDPLNAEIIFASVIHSIEKITELIAALNDVFPDWKKEIDLAHLEKCIELNEVLFLKGPNSKVLPKKTMLVLKEEKDRIIGALRKEIDRK